MSCRVSIDSGILVLLALLLLTLPAKWIIGFVFAAAWHEICHYGALSLAGIRVHGLRIGVGGMVMDIPELTTGQEFICALAGPLGGLLLLAFCRWFPEAGICALMQSAYNMLPLYPLDGGRVLRCLTKWLCPQYSEQICFAAEILTIVGILLVGIIVNWGIISVFAIFSLAGKLLHGKIPCKLYKVRVQ